MISITGGFLGAALFQIFTNRHLAVAEAEAELRPVGRQVTQ